MKKLLSLILAIILSSYLTACDAETEPSIDTGTTPTGSTTSSNSADSAAIGDIIQFSGFDWRVLDVQIGNALIIAVDIMERRGFHDKWESSTWADSELRQWLNGEFYNITFKDSEKPRIIETPLENKENPWFKTTGGIDTNDKIFLLSLEEVVKYFGDSRQLSNGPNDTNRIDDKYNSARIVDIKKDNTSWWWLRSYGSNNFCAAFVTGEGLINVDGMPIDHNGGIRPALWIKIN